MTKAERLFNRNYRACKKHIEAWGFENIGFNRIDCEDDESVPTRTCNAIQKLIDQQRKHLERCVKLGISENIELRTQALEMLQITLNNQRRINEKWKAI